MSTLRPLQSDMNTNVPQSKAKKPAKPAAAEIRPEPVRETDESDEEIQVGIAVGFTELVLIRYVDATTVGS